MSPLCAPDCHTLVGHPVALDRLSCMNCPHDQPLPADGSFRVGYSTKLSPIEKIIALREMSKR